MKPDSQFHKRVEPEPFSSASLVNSVQLYVNS
jgi:hypothetical protein